MTTTPAQPDRDRACVNCGRPLHIPARAPHKRYCSPRCRVADWHRRNDRPATHQTERPAPNTVPEPRNAVNAVPAAATGSGRCPHCHQPVAVISVLVTPAAAHVPVPTPPGGRQLP